MSANNKQIAGDHYKQFKGLEPWDVVGAWDLGYLDGTALKYIARWRHKNGIEDLHKAIHFLEKLIEVESGKSDNFHRAANSSYTDLSKPVEYFMPHGELNTTEVIRGDRGSY